MIKYLTEPQCYLQNGPNELLSSPYWDLTDSQVQNRTWNRLVWPQTLPLIILWLNIIILLFITLNLPLICDLHSSPGSPCTLQAFTEFNKRRRLPVSIALVYQENTNKIPQTFIIIHEYSLLQYFIKLFLRSWLFYSAVEMVWSNTRNTNLLLMNTVYSFRGKKQQVSTNIV